jgi:tetratricopeptide (TPR) repeat protein
MLFLNVKTFKVSCIFLILSLFAGAQTTKKLSLLYQDKLQKADEYVILSNYKTAIELYHEVFEKSGEDTSIICKIANTYRLMGDSKNAEDWYRRVIVTNENTINPMYKLQFAQTLTINGKYEEALYWFKAYYKVFASDKRAMEAIKSIENISNLYYDTTFYVVYPISVNTASTEFSPCFYKDGLLFLSDRKNTKSSLLSWYFTAMDPGGAFSTPQKFDTGIKNEYNAGPMCLFDHDTKMIFSRNYASGKMNKNKVNEIPLQLFSAKQDGQGKWTNTQALPFQEKDYSYTQPTITGDGKTLLFVSNMPGGFGGTDIYMSKFENETWSKPVNLGDSINTPGNEMFPYIFQDSILFFSSDGHGGLGGLDILKTNLSGHVKLKNMGVPVNSTNDDFGIVVDKDGLSGFLASDRQNGAGEDDIYGFKMIRISLSLKVVDGNTSIPVANAEIFTIDTVNEKRIGITDQDGSCTLIVPVCKSLQVRIKREHYETKLFTFESVVDARNRLAVVPIKTEEKHEEVKIILTDDNHKQIDNSKGVVYKVQIFASRIPTQMNEIKRKYKGNMDIQKVYEDKWYKWTIGEYPSYTEARKCFFSSGVYDAFIVAYVDGKKVHITIAKANTHETQVPSPFRRGK